METLSKTIKRLSDNEYQALLEKISVSRHSKPYIVLEAARNQDLTDSEMINLLQVNPSTYYTLKSRLNVKIASFLSKKVDNPISVLMEEVARVPANMYAPNKHVTIRALKELEKQLIEYDLSNELIVVYKALSILHIHNPAEFDHYDKLHGKYVAYALASSKAEFLFHEFFVKLGLYELNRTEDTLEAVRGLMRELSNIAELYDSHRMYVFYNLTRVYYLFSIAERPDILQAKEIEIDNTLQEIKNVFDRYPLDTLYTNLRFIIDFLYFGYYQRAGNWVRAKYYYIKTNNILPVIGRQHMLHFHMIQYLHSKVFMAIASRDVSFLTEGVDEMKNIVDIDKEEAYHYISFRRYLAILNYYLSEYSGAARILNQLRNTTNLKSYWHTDVDVRLFQALQYALMHEEDLCLQITNSITRSLRDDDDKESPNIKLFIKILKAAFKDSDVRKKQTKLRHLFSDFKAANVGRESILAYVQMDEELLAKLSR